MYWCGGVLSIGVCVAGRWVLLFVCGRLSGVVGVLLVMSSYMLIFEVMFRPFVGVGRFLVKAGVVLCISAIISGMFSGVRRRLIGENWFVVVISVFGSGVSRRVLFIMCLCGDLCQLWLYVSSDVSWLGVGSWLCFRLNGWYGEFLSLLWTCVAVFVAVVLSCFFLCLCFSVLWNGWVCRGGCWM